MVYYKPKSLCTETFRISNEQLLKVQVVSILLNFYGFIATAAFKQRQMS